MKKLFFLTILFVSVLCFGQEPKRALKMVTFSGSGYDLGLQHGKQLKDGIAAIISKWKTNTTRQLGKEADSILKEFLEYANFTESIKKWTPDLYEEVKGIAEGSGQKFNDIFVLNLLDEFWVYVNNVHNHHCSGIGVPAMNGNPGYLSQNMDLENYTDGFQVLMRLERTIDRPEQLILTHPGLIALNGLNEEGIGVCVNTLIPLNASSNGLPVAFIIRRIINSTNKKKLLDFVKNVNHASGQNYIIGIQGEVYDFEASANKVVRFNPKNTNGAVYHTNHPIVNDDVKPWFEKYNPKSTDAYKLNTDSHQRFYSVKERIASQQKLTDQVLMNTLKSKDSKEGSVCKANQNDGMGFTFASVVMTISEKPYLQIVAGPPDEDEFIRVDFSLKK
ncbi:C45 family autoproteolytic acyltransferase/hydolase [Allomuricauda sp. R78024]|uniref:C45 family autoproteolytic acyltransferase/hydolase n=1 Tax=Allomuricauda sp. R78024 TaxID=3093867 RepID=UPI0037C6A5FB